MPKTAYTARRSAAALIVALVALLGCTTATAAQHQPGSTSIVARMLCSSCGGGF